MSINNSILKLLNMKDSNLIFDENFCEERNFKSKRCLIIRGYLKNEFEYCPYCGCINDNTIIKYGTKTCLIKIPKISGLDSYLELKKQKYLCKICNKRMTASTKEIDYRCRICNNTKHSVICYAKKILPHTYIAKEHNISNVSVQRIINKVYDNKTLYKRNLPEVICIDEFTAMKKTMAFNFCDAKTGKTIDLVLDRKLENLTKYFRYYLKEARDKVKFVVMDMYKPYITLVNEVFKNARIIIDLFHIVQLISKSLNKTRIQAMKKDKINYRKMKRYYRLLLKPRLELDCSKWKKYMCFKNLMTEVDIVDYILEQNDELKKTYELYQNILYALQRRDYKLFSKIIEKEYIGISKYMETSLKTLIEFKKHIKNTLEQPYSNGIMERNNNTCKLIKRVAFGFKNFSNLKARVLIATNIFRNEKSGKISFTTP